MFAVEVKRDPEKEDYLTSQIFARDDRFRQLYERNNFLIILQVKQDDHC